MILRELKLDPFAGMSRLHVVFQDTLNVILGANEAGKSTLVNAVKMVLFMPTKYDKRTLENDIRPLMPLTGGDTIQVEAVFYADGGEYRLRKAWGEKKESELRLPGGGILTDPTEVHKKVQELLVSNEGTYRNVLIGFQSGLSNTLESLKRDQTATEALASVLREGIIETDGVSVEKLNQAIQKSHKEYFSHWDIELRRPEGNKGVENPYKKEVGKTLQAYYENEELLRLLGQAIDYEKQMADLDQKILTLSEEISSLRKFIEVNKTIIEDARKRVVLEISKKSLEDTEKKLREISQKWPAMCQGMKNAGEKCKDLEERFKQLDQEYNQAVIHELHKVKLDRFVRAEKKKKDLESAKGALSGMKVIDDQEYEKLHDLYNQLSRLRTGFEAGRIALALHPEKAMEVKVRKDLEEENVYSLASGQPLEVAAGGQIQIDHPDWKLSVRSGSEDFSKLNATYSKLSNDYETLLDQLKVTDYPEGEKIYAEYKNQTTFVENLQKQFDDVLEGEAYEDLEALSKSVARDHAFRSTKDIADDRGTLKGKMVQAENEIKSMTEQLQEWETEYKSQESLLDALVEKRAELKQQGKDLQSLKPLPEGVIEPEKFIQEFEAKQGTLKNKENELSEKRIEKARLEGEAPDDTREEIEVESKKADSRFQQVLMEGDAISTILAVFNRTKSAMDSQPLGPWLEQLQRVLSPLTVDRYNGVTLQGERLRDALRADGVEVPFEALSVGTKVGLGLALRLSMARYFLKDLGGFMILDDPLVDLDPVRQQATAAVIKGFSEDKQVIILTCHPAHADLLGGNFIALKNEQPLKLGSGVSASAANS